MSDRQRAKELHTRFGKYGAIAKAFSCNTFDFTFTCTYISKMGYFRHMGLVDMVFFFFFLRVWRIISRVILAGTAVAFRVYPLQSICMNLYLFYHKFSKSRFSRLSWEKYGSCGGHRGGLLNDTFLTRFNLSSYLLPD